jgi:coniferyl-aldehyde dehydrogenase
MADGNPNQIIDNTDDALVKALEIQRASFLAEGLPRAAVRRDRIARLIDLVVLNADAFVDALRDDYGHRSSIQSLLTDVIGPMPSLKSDMKNVAKWMRPQRVSAGPLALLGSRARVEWVPRGIVGIISPWNFPIGLALQPLAQAFAAGNRGMVKVSEFTPRTGELLKQLVADFFDPAEAVVITGGPEVGAAFSKMPFDLVFFTGATGIARHVQRACADNLVPCVLELGGKSPVVIAPDANLSLVAKRVAVAKTLNAGQICLSPDYVFVPEGKENAFADAMFDALGNMFPSLIDNDDYTSVVTERHFKRLGAHLDDAAAKGAELRAFNPARESFDSQPHHKLMPTLVLGAKPEMTIMQEEIFGPLLPVMTYRHIDEVVKFINARPRPLATYYFGPEDSTCRYYLDHTHSGGVSLNDVLVHVTNENLPFGGIGDSGMGYYHGRSGFETFSHPRAIAKSGRFSPISMMAPPYGPRFRWMVDANLNRERRAAEKRIAARKQKEI